MPADAPVLILDIREEPFPLLSRIQVVTRNFCEEETGTLGRADVVVDVVYEFSRCPFELPDSTGDDERGHDECVDEGLQMTWPFERHNGSRSIYIELQITDALLRYS